MIYYKELSVNGFQKRLPYNALIEAFFSALTSYNYELLKFVEELKFFCKNSRIFYIIKE